jgi:hypothetical protein
MEDTITISLRALNQECRDKIEKILDTQLNVVPDEINEEALETLRNFSE